MIELLQPKENINERVRFYIIECPWHYIHNDLQERKNSEYDKQFKQLLLDFKNLLETGSEKQKILTLNILFHGEQRNTSIFSYKLVNYFKKPDQYVIQLLGIIETWKKDKDFNPSFLCGMIKGLNEWDTNKTKQILDKIATDVDLLDFLIPAYFQLKLQNQDINRLIDVIDKVSFRPGDLGALATGKKCEAVSPEIIGRFMQILIDKETQFGWEALKIYNYYTEIPKQKSKLITVLYALLTKDKLLSDKKRYDSMDDHYYKEAVKDILSSEYGEMFSQNFYLKFLNLRSLYLIFLSVILQ